jgi:hypothetical protein
VCVCDTTKNLFFLTFFFFFFFFSADAIVDRQVTMAGGGKTAGTHTYVPRLRESIAKLDARLALTENLNNPDTYSQKTSNALRTQRSALIAEERQVIASFARQKRLEASIRNHPFLADKLKVEREGDKAYKKDLFVEMLRNASPAALTRADFEESAKDRRQRKRDAINAGGSSYREQNRFGKNVIYLK